MFFILEIIRLGLYSLRLHKLRTFLTSLGIILGVAAVIVMVSIGEGNMQAALRQIQALGATNIIVRSERPPESASMGGEQRSFLLRYGLTRQDLRRIEFNMPDAAYIVPLKSVGSEVTSEWNRVTSQAYGVTPELREVANLRLEPRGRYITAEDVRRASPVAVIGARVAEKFFRLRDPIGATFRVDSQLFRVIGVLQPIGLAGGKGSALVGRDWNDDVHIPITTAEIQFGDQITRRTSGSFQNEELQLAEIFITAPDTDSVIEDADRIRRILEASHDNLADVKIIVPWELLEEAKRVARIGNVVTILIASVSLLVGGIGIMNIMLATVTERTREIGIRRALGATRRHVIAQFLVETSSLSMLGGLLGIAIGVGLAMAIDHGLPALNRLGWFRSAMGAPIELEADVTAWSIVVSFLVAASVGIIFGLYPAILASRKDPVVALRHD